MTQKRLLAALLTFALPFGAFACKKEPKKNAGGTGGAVSPLAVTPSGQKPPPIQAATPGSETKIQLLSQGEEPRKLLRYKPTAGSKQAFELDMDIGMKMDIGGVTPPMPTMPTIQMGMELEIQEVLPNGDFRAAFRINRTDVKEKAGTDPNVVSAMRTAMGQIGNFTAKGLFSDRGVVREISFDLPASVPPAAAQMMESMKQQMGQMAAPLPEEPVGVGAKWRAVQALKMNGFAISQTVDTELTALEGEQVHLKMTLAQHADPQDLSGMPGMPPGANAKLDSMDSVGDGEAESALGSVFPTSLRMKLDMQMAATIEAGGRKNSMKMDMNMTISARETR